MRRFSEADDPAIRDMMAETTVCLCCGVQLKYHHRKEGRRNRGYCRLTCYFNRPPKMVYAEKQWRKPIAQLMVDLLNQYSPEATAGLLGISKHTLYQWIGKLNLRRVSRWAAGA